MIVVFPRQGSVLLDLQSVLWEILGKYEAAAGGQYMASFSVNQTLHAEGSLSALTTWTDDLSLAAANFDKAEIQATIVFSASTCRPCWLRAYRSIDGGTTFDQTPVCEHSITPASGLTVSESIVVESPYVHVMLSNLDPSNAVTATVKYAGRQFVPAP